LSSPSRPQLHSLKCFCSIWVPEVLSGLTTCNSFAGPALCGYCGVRYNVGRNERFYLNSMAQQSVAVAAAPANGTSTSCLACDYSGSTAASPPRELPEQEREGVEGSGRSHPARAPQAPQAPPRTTRHPDHHLPLLPPTQPPPPPFSPIITRKAAAVVHGPVRCLQSRDQKAHKTMLPGRASDKTCCGPFGRK
jgi:hypothetical protein